MSDKQKWDVVSLRGDGMMKREEKTFVAKVGLSSVVRFCWCWRVPLWCCRRRCILA